jgi:hypothetical protein
VWRLLSSSGDEVPERQKLQLMCYGRSYKCARSIEYTAQPRWCRMGRRAGDKVGISTSLLLVDPPPSLAFIIVSGAGVRQWWLC